MALRPERSLDTHNSKASFNSNDSDYGEEEERKLGLGRSASH